MRGSTGCTALALLIALFPISGVRADPGDVAGLWSSGDAVLKVAPRPDGTLSMMIVAIEKPRYATDEATADRPAGSPRLDDNNPDPGLRRRPLIGLELLMDYRYRNDRWQGRVYDPETGNVYRSFMEAIDHGGARRLKMRGYLGMPMLGRTRSFEPVVPCPNADTATLAAYVAEKRACTAPAIRISRP